MNIHSLIFRERRFGQFHITARLLESEPAMVQALLSQVIVTRCEYHYDAGAFHYIAWSSDFMGILDGCAPPQYRIVIDHAKEYLRFTGPDDQIVKLGPAEELVS